MNIGSAKFKEDGKKSEFNPSDITATYEIDGQNRKPPKPIETFHTSAFLYVFCPGYKTQVIVNGIEQGTSINKICSGLIEGKHTFTFTINQ